MRPALLGALWRMGQRGAPAWQADPTPMSPSHLASSRGGITFILDRLPLPNQARVVDVGCGDGRHTRELADRGYSVTGMDIAPRLIERARQGDATSAVFHVSDGRDPLPGGPYDLALCVYDVFGSSARPEDD